MSNYILSFSKPKPKQMLYTFSVDSDDYTIPSYMLLHQDISEDKCIFPQNLNGYDGGTYKYFIYEGNLYFLKDNLISIIDSVGWTHIAGSTGADLSYATTVAFGIKDGYLFKIEGRDIVEIGSNITSNKFINVTGTTSGGEAGSYGEHAYALTDKNEIIAIGDNIELKFISGASFTESNVVNYFGGMHYYEATPHIVVDNKLYLLDKENLVFRDESRKYVKVFGAYSEYTGSVCYQFAIDESNNLYKLYTSGIPTSSQIILGNEEDNSKWEYVAGVRYRTYSSIPAIANKKLYYLIPGEDPDDMYSEGESTIQKAVLLDSTHQYDWVSNVMTTQGQSYIALADNKLYHIKISQSLDENNKFVWTPAITEMPMPSTHTKCIKCHQYGANTFVLIFQ